MSENKRPLIAVDNDIPFIKGRLEPFASVRYLSQEEFSPDTVADADAMIIRTRTRCDASLLEGSNVKIIATATIGMDQFNLEDCMRLGIKTANAPGCNAPGVAQYVWSSILRLGVNPHKATIGIIGHGNVGSIVDEWGKNLGADILLNDPPKYDLTENDKYRSLHEILPLCDVVTLHTPMRKNGKYPTYHLISDKELSLMKPGAIIINAARGPVVDTQALIKAIDDKNLQAVIDCWEGEPSINRDLLDRTRIATFHIAGYSYQGKQRATRMALENIAAHFGFRLDLSDLTGQYISGREISASDIMESFDPMPVDKLLRENPGSFDKMRAEYVFRNELLSD